MIGVAHHTPTHACPGFFVQGVQPEKRRPNLSEATTQILRRWLMEVCLPRVIGTLHDPQH